MVAKEAERNVKVIDYRIPLDSLPKIERLLPSSVHNCTFLGLRDENSKRSRPQVIKMLVKTRVNSK